MLKHYFKIAVRSLAKQKVLTFINISRSVDRLACFILFLLYAVNEFNFDRFHANADNIYRVYRWTEPMEGKDAEGDVYLPNPLGPALKTDLTDVVDFVRLQDGWRENFVKIDDKGTKRHSFIYRSFFL
jgi:putative ABC transport system permease protein